MTTPKKKKQDKGTGNLVLGGAATAYGAANAPVLRAGNKDMSRMINTSPKKQASRYQAELHQAMQRGSVKTDSPVHVLRTPSGRNINAGGTHRQIARQAMGKPSEYQVKNISHEIHVSPATKLHGRLRVAAAQRGSKRVEAGKPVKPVSDAARAVNRVKAAGADVADAHIWSHPSAISGPVKAGRTAGLKGAGLVIGGGALSTAVGLHQRHEWKKKHPVAKSRTMSDTEIRHRKKIQGTVSRTTGALGLAGVGAFGAARLGGAGKAALKAQKVAPVLRRVNPKKADLVALGASTTAGGIGGAGSFNFASYTSAEAKKRKPAMPVTKGLTDDVGVYGEVGKKWEPSTSKYDSERSRLKRAQAYEDVGGPATGALAAGAGIKAVKAGKLVQANRKVRFTPAKNLPNVQGKMAGRTAEAIGHGKTAAVLGGAAAATGAATMAVRNRNRSRSWAPYAKRSAFGVDHGGVVSGQHRETEN